MKLAISLFLWASVGVTDAFAPSHWERQSVARMRMSEPSDTSSDDFVTVDSEPYEPSAEDMLVSNVIDLMPSSVGDVSPETRSAINEAIYKLEAVNPTPEPTLSSLLNGVWELRYVGGYDGSWALPSPTRQFALFLYSDPTTAGLIYSVPLL